MKTFDYSYHSGGSIGQCMRCGFDKRWPAHNCDHKPMSFLRRNVVRLTQPPLVLDGLYNRRKP